MERIVEIKNRLVKIKMKMSVFLFNLKGSFLAKIV